MKDARDHETAISEGIRDAVSSSSSPPPPSQQTHDGQQYHQQHILPAGKLVSSLNPPVNQQLVTTERSPFLPSSPPPPYYTTVDDDDGVAARTEAARALCGERRPLEVAEAHNARLRTLNKQCALPGRGDARPAQLHPPSARSHWLCSHFRDPAALDHPLGPRPRVSTAHATADSPRAMRPSLLTSDTTSCTWSRTTTR